MSISDIIAPLYILATSFHFLELNRHQTGAKVITEISVMDIGLVYLMCSNSMLVGRTVFSQALRASSPP